MQCNKVIIQQRSACQHRAMPCHSVMGVAGLTRALRFLKLLRRASKKQKKTAELMPLLSARGPTPLQHHVPTQMAATALCMSCTTRLHLPRTACHAMPTHDFDLVSSYAYPQHKLYGQACAGSGAHLKK